MRATVGNRVTPEVAASNAWSRMSFKGGEPDVQPAPDTKPTTPGPSKDPSYPPHTPPQPDRVPAPCETPEEEWFPACVRSRGVRG